MSSRGTSPRRRRRAYKRRELGGQAGVSQLVHMLGLGKVTQRVDTKVGQTDPGRKVGPGQWRLTLDTSTWPPSASARKSRCG